MAVDTTHTSDTSAPAETERTTRGTHEVRSMSRVVIRFAGDSGDGMQLTGDRFTSETASFGNDLSTLPNFP
ncbi:2-oxoglutarate ferredoxin oxidoreductase subunit alpha, partial [Streptomyces sp. NPDC007264]